MFRNIAILFLASLIASQPALAQTPAPSASLPPGKAAGVHQAQMAVQDTIFIAIGLAVIAGGLYLAKTTYNTPSPAPSGTGH